MELHIFALVLALDLAHFLVDGLFHLVDVIGLFHGLGLQNFTLILQVCVKSLDGASGFEILLHNLVRELTTHQISVDGRLTVLKDTIHIVG